MIRKLLRSTAVLSALALSATTAQAQFAGSGCGGYTFIICANWSAALSNGNTVLTLTVSNTSGGGSALNPASVVTHVGIGNLPTIYNVDLAASTGPAGFAAEQEVQGFNTLGEDSFGSDLNGNAGILAGQQGVFTFVLASGTFLAADFANAQVAFHDQGAVGNCGPSSKAVFNANTGALVTGNGSTASGCFPGGGGQGSVVPEPSTYLLLGSGLLGLVGIARRRRNDG